MQLDIEQCEQLESYLRAKGYVAPKESLQTERLAGGVSNKTMLVNFTDGRSWVLKQALPKLRVTVDWFCDPRRIEREAAGLRCLVDLAPHGTITPFIFEDREQHLLAMGSVPSPHENWKNLLLAGNIDENLVQQFGKLLATIHTRATTQRLFYSLNSPIAHFSRRSDWSHITVTLPAKSLLRRRSCRI